MIVKGTVKLKILILLATTNLLISAIPTPEVIPEHVREERLEAERAEEEWVHALIRGPEVVNRTIEESTEPNPSVIYPDQSLIPDGSIECLFYDENECKTKGECNMTTTICHPEKHLKLTGCVAVFNYPINITTNSTEKYYPVNPKLYKTLGCMQFQHNDLMACVQTDSCRQKKLSKTGLGVCCCTTHNCNHPDNIYLLNPDVEKGQ